MPELPLLLPELPLFPLLVELVELVELVLLVELALVELPPVELLLPLVELVDPPVEDEPDVEPPVLPVDPLLLALARLIMLVVAAMLELIALPNSTADTAMPPPITASIKAYSGAAAPRLSAHHFFIRLLPQTVDSLSFYIERANEKCGLLTSKWLKLRRFRASFTGCSVRGIYPAA